MTIKEIQEDLQHETEVLESYYIGQQEHEDLVNLYDEMINSWDVNGIDQ